MNLHSAHMDPDDWDQPQQFRPERFLDESGNVIGGDQIIPFSLGSQLLFTLRLYIMSYILVFQMHQRQWVYLEDADDDDDDDDGFPASSCSTKESMKLTVVTGFLWAGYSSCHSPCIVKSITETKSTVKDVSHVQIKQLYKSCIYFTLALAFSSIITFAVMNETTFSNSRLL